MIRELLRDLGDVLTAHIDQVARTVIRAADEYRYRVIERTSIHVMPEIDHMEHDTDDCPCGPCPMETVGDDSRLDWLIVHHPLDADQYDAEDVDD